MNEGIKYGKGLFETIKVVERKPVYLEDHIERLKNSMNFLGMNTKNIRENIKAEIENIDLDTDCLRVMVLDNNGDYDLFINTRNTDYSDLKYTQGLKLKVLNQLRDKNNPLVYHKTNNYLLNDYLHKELLKEGFDEGVFLNQDGNVTEGTYTNLFFIQENTFITPHLADGMLPGIFRKKLIEFLKIKGYNIIEKSIKLSDLQSMDCCFATNSLMEMRFVRQIDEIMFSKSNLFCEISEKLMNEY
ncbi:aminotransferase class IV [Finegoldia magna]|uniref:aminotransferase class IV n=1 Tax=Finegoldia magna TaxID=1260 RepID=UPI0028FFE3BA|nr:aminotransferase class IV [Finegoldia magna]MDU1579034.1 aminotransferase class IV [Finegoldia magna]